MPALRDLFRKSGRPLEQVADLVPITDPRFYIVFTDGTVLDLPLLDRADQRRAWRTVGERTAEQTALLDSYADVWETVRTTALDQPPPRRQSVRALADAAAVAVAGAGRVPAAGRRTRASGADLLRRGVPLGPRRTPATSVWSRTWSEPSAAGPSPTLAALVDALAKRLVERRVEVRLGAEVAAVATSGGAVRGVRLSDGELLATDAVVSDLDPRVLYEELVYAPEADGVRKQPEDARRRGDVRGASGCATRCRICRSRPCCTATRWSVLVATAPAGHRAWSVLVHGYPTEDALDLLTGRGSTSANRW